MDEMIIEEECGEIEILSPQTEQMVANEEKLFSFVVTFNVKSFINSMVMPISSALATGPLFLIYAMAYGTETVKTVPDNIIDQRWMIIVTHTSVAISAFCSLSLVFDAIGTNDDMILVYSNREVIHSERCRGSLYPLWLAGTRGGALGIFILIDILIPHFSLFMAIIRSISSSFAAFFFQPLFNVLLFRNVLKIYQKIERIPITAFGFAACVLHAFSSSARL
ncbi:hypothetical protein ACTXT7_005529 [Hymenolepis weldensis]